MKMEWIEFAVGLQALQRLRVDGVDVGSIVFSSIKHNSLWTFNLPRKHFNVSIDPIYYAETEQSAKDCVERYIILWLLDKNNSLNDIAWEHG